ncbi:OmpA family protein [Aquirufa sp.]|jgi:outer membrane protein OmpA-like peptidoglycan-associated protein|uniref:OmpA family protein n=1 Tax=Aquirufa sp. TaxID=2676249 RepID=UPI0037BEF589
MQAKSIHNFRFFAFLTILITVIGCNSERQISNKALKYFDRGEYELVIQTLKPQVEKNLSGDKSAYWVAESYRLSNRIGLALPYYQKAVLQGSEDPLIQYHLAMSAKALGDYTLCKTSLGKFLQTKPNRFNQIKAEIELENLDKIPALLQKQSPVSLFPLMGNTSKTEFGAQKIGNELLFTSSSKPLVYKNNGLPFLGLYSAPLLKENEISTPHLFSTQLYKENANDGTPAFSHDGNTIVFARGNTGKSKDPSPDVDLYISKKNGSSWSEPERMAISDSIAWDGSPCFSTDDRTLYFSSNRRGGKGGLDLYRVAIDNSGRFGRPINLGSIINSPGDEIFPYVSDNGKLYFSSDGHPSIGGLDLYVASRNENEISIEHLGVPLNSIGDDFAINLSDPLSGYISSNRPGGKGDDDIYYFKSSGSEDHWWSSDTTSSQSNEKIKQVNYALAVQIVHPDGKALSGARVSVRRNNETSEVMTSNPSGKIEMITLNPGDEINFKSDKDGYISARSSFSMEGREIPQVLLKKEITDTTFYIKIVMDEPEIGKEISQFYQLNSIYYDLDKSDIRPDASIELDKIVNFLQDNPQVNLELGAHTDARATASYNQKLSQRRAESAVKYILQRGILKDRIVPKGYGESQLINECSDGVDCPEDMHQQNRRTEFKIIQIKQE